MSVGNKDVRWQQRFSNYTKALTQLTDAIQLSQERDLSELEQQGLIQAFEYTHELAWNTLKDFLKSRGARGIYGSKDATREAFKLGLIKNGDIWMDMIQSRNKTSHTYNEEVAKEIVAAIEEDYFAEFTKLQVTLTNLEAEEQNEP